MMSRKKITTSMNETTELIDVDSIKSEPEDNSSVSLANPIVIAPETPNTPNSKAFYLLNDRQQVLITPKSTQPKILSRFSTIITLPSSSKNLLSTLSSKQPTSSPTLFPSRPITIPTEIMFSSRSIDADGTVKSLVEYLCNFCQFKSVDKNEHQRHKDTHTFHCHLCSFSAFSRMDVLKHKKQEHPSCWEELQGYVELEKLMEDRSFRNQSVTVIKTVNKPLSSLQQFAAVHNNNSNVLQHVTTLHNNLHLSTMQKNHNTIPMSAVTTTNSIQQHTSTNEDTLSNINNNTPQYASNTNSHKTTKSDFTVSEKLINTRPKRTVVVNRTPVIDDSDHEINDNVISLIDNVYSNKRSHSNTDSFDIRGKEEQEKKKRRTTEGGNQISKGTEEKEEQNGKNVLKKMLSPSLSTLPTTQQNFPAAKYVTWSCFYCKFTSAVQQTSLRHVISAHPQQPVQLRRLSYSALPSKTTLKPPSSTQQASITTQSSTTSKKSFMEETCLWGCYYCNSRCTNRNNIIQHIKQQHPSSKLVVTRRKMASTPYTALYKTSLSSSIDSSLNDKTQNKENLTKNNFFSLQMECSDDNKTDDVAVKSTTTSFIHRSQSGWACVYCEHQSNNRKQMANHVMSAHSDDPVRFLNLAPWRQKHKGLHGPRSVRDEVMMRHGNWMWQCPLCTRCHVSKSFILLHIKVAHPNSSSANKNGVTPLRISKQHTNVTSKSKEAVLRLYSVSPQHVLDNLIQASFDGFDSFEHDVHRHRRYACGKCGWRGFRTNVVKKHFLHHHPHINISIREHKVTGDRRLRRSKKALMWFACPCCPFISKNKSMLRQHLQQNPDHKLKNKNKKPDNDDEQHDDDDSTAGGAGGGGVNGGGSGNGGDGEVLFNGVSNDTVNDGFCNSVDDNKKEESKDDSKLSPSINAKSTKATPEIEASNDENKTAVEDNAITSVSKAADRVSIEGINSTADVNIDFNSLAATAKRELNDIKFRQNRKDINVSTVVIDSLATATINITSFNSKNTAVMSHLSAVESNVATSDITTGLSLLRKTLSTAPKLFCDMKKINKNDNRNNNNNQSKKNQNDDDFKGSFNSEHETTLNSNTITTTKNLFTHLNTHTPFINHSSIHPSTILSTIHSSTFSSSASNSSPIISTPPFPPLNNCKPGHFKYTVDGKLLKKPNHSSIARAFSNQRYKCPHCSATYGLPQLVKKHMLGEHMSLWQGSVCCVDLRAKQLRKRQKVLFCIEPLCSFYCKQEIEFEGHEKECPLVANVDATDMPLPHEHYDNHDKNNISDNSNTPTTTNNSNELNGGSKGHKEEMKLGRDNILQKSYVCSGCSFKSTNCNAIRQHITDYHENSIKYSEVCSRLNKDGDIITCVNDVNLNDNVNEKILAGDSWETGIAENSDVTFKNHFEGISYHPSDVIENFLSASNSSTEAITALSETASDKPDDKIYTQL